MSAVGVLACASLAGLTGCETITAVGSTGMSVDVQGRPVVVFAVCNDNIVGTSISRDRTMSDPKREDPSVSVAEWEAESPVTPSTARQASLNIAEPDALWSPVGPSESLRQGVVYDAHGWNRENNLYTHDVRFTTERLAQLKPGQVLTQVYRRTRDQSEDLVQTDTQFRADAC